jgi:hypothetical protein
MKPLYFGVLVPKQAGHHLYDSVLGVRDTSLPPSLKEHHLDGGYCIYKPGQPQGEALIHHLDGFTVMAMWDRTGDSRPGSSSTFVMEGTHAYPAMCRLASEAFPAVWKRLSAKPVVLGSLYENQAVVGLPRAVRAWWAENPGHAAHSIELSSSLWDRYLGCGEGILNLGASVDRNVMLPLGALRLSLSPAVPDRSNVDATKLFLELVAKL